MSEVMKNLILLRGLPGSGKSTVAELFKDYAVVSADDYFTQPDGSYVFEKDFLCLAHRDCKIKVHKHMTAKLDIVVANTFTQEWELQPYLDLAKEFEYRVHTLIVENRHGSESIHNVPSDSLLKMKNRFEVSLTPNLYDKLVRVKHYKDKGLYLHKYSRKVFYDNLWNSEPRLLDARGTVYDERGNLVLYPFTKVFSLGENGTSIPLDHDVLAFRKINGFMLSVTRHRGDLLFATTGSLDSEFVKMGKELFPECFSKHIKEGYTCNFEIVHPDDPHVIEEEIGCYLIGIRENVLHSRQELEVLLEFKRLASEIGVLYPEATTLKFGDLLEKVKHVKHEGYMVYDLDSDVVLKLKSPYYLTSKFLARTKKVDLIFRGDYKKFFDEEFYSLVEWIQSTISKEGYANLSGQERLEIIRDFYGQKL